MRTEIINKINGYNSHSFPVPDTDMFLRISRLCRLANLSDLYSGIRIHEGSFTAKNLKAIIQKNYEIIKGKKLNKLASTKKFYTQVFYKNGIINFIERKYFKAGYNFFLSFIFAPIKSINYFSEKLKIIT